MKEKLHKAVFLMCLVPLLLLQVSCQTDKEFTGYDDLLGNSPTLLWGSSIEDVKEKYPNVSSWAGSSYAETSFGEDNPKGPIIFRSFEFINNQLFMVHVSYGSYTDDMLELLKQDIIAKYGKITIEDNGTIERWDIEKTRTMKL